MPEGAPPLSADRCVRLPQAAYGAETGGAGDGITSSVGFQYTIGSVGYTPVTNVVSYLHVTDDTCALKEELAAADWAGASAVYQEGSADRYDSPPRLTRLGVGSDGSVCRALTQALWPAVDIRIRSAPSSTRPSEAQAVMLGIIEAAAEEF